MQNTFYDISHDWRILRTSCIPAGSLYNIRRIPYYYYRTPSQVLISKWIFKTFILYFKELLNTISKTNFRNAVYYEINIYINFVKNVFLLRFSIYFSNVCALTLKFSWTFVSKVDFFKSLKVLHQIFTNGRGNPFRLLYSNKLYCHDAFHANALM